MNLAEEKKYSSNCDHSSVKGIFDKKDTIFLQELLRLRKTDIFKFHILIYGQY